MNNKFNATALGYSGAIVAASGMLLLSIASNFGIYTGAADQMMKWHLFYNTGIVGTISGMIEAAIISFVFLYFFGLVYNKFSK